MAKTSEREDKFFDVCLHVRLYRVLPVPSGRSSTIDHTVLRAERVRTCP